MTKYRKGSTPQLYPFRILTMNLKAEIFTLEGDTLLPKGEHILPQGTKVEVIKVQGKTTAIGLLGEKRITRTQQFTMFSVSSSKLFEKSSAL